MTLFKIDTGQPPFGGLALRACMFYIMDSGSNRLYTTFPNIFIFISANPDDLSHVFFSTGPNFASTGHRVGRFRLVPIFRLAPGPVAEPVAKKNMEASALICLFILHHPLLVDELALEMLYFRKMKLH